MKGYKAFDSNLSCRGHKFSVGEEYKVEGKPVLCVHGFHFCENPSSVFNYYAFSTDNRVCEVEALGEVVTNDDKSVTNHLRVVKELSWQEVLELCNSGKANTGLNNSGHYNSGNRNSGYGNSGNWNSGDGNSGDWNSGHGNSGYGNSGYGNSGHGNSGNRNSGNWNSGNWNSGNWNSGNQNSGHWNSGDQNSGYFNSTIPKVRLFNKESDLDFNSKSLQNVNNIINKYWKPVLTRVTSENMTEGEKTNNPSHKTTGGFLRKSEDGYKKTWQHVWEKMSDDEKKEIIGLPNFDAVVFEDITGVKV